MPLNIDEYKYRIKWAHLHGNEATSTSFILIDRDFEVLIDLVAFAENENQPIPNFLKCYQRC